MQEFGGIEEKKHHRLSRREFQVLNLLAEGNSPTKIAELLGLSIKTISTYKRHILNKLEINSTTELIRYCLQNKLIYVWISFWIWILFNWNILDN